MTHDEIHIVHISDLQAGGICLAEVKTKDLKQTKRAERYAHYARVLAADAITVLKDKGRNPRIHLLVVSGDVANKALPTEYDEAKVFLKTLVTTLKLKWNNVVIVPGNHDVNWPTLKEAWGRRRLKTPEQIEDCGALPKKMTVFKRWINHLYHEGDATYHYSFARPIHFNKISCKQLVVVGFDSCESCVFERKRGGKNRQDPWEFGRGAVGNKQLEVGLKPFMAADSSKIRIAVLHHNPFPQSEPDTVSALKDADGFRKTLAAHDVSLILAGHLHQAQYHIHTDPTRRADRLCHTLITGPCCMQTGGREFAIGKDHKEVFPNRYQILSIDCPSYSISLYLRRFSLERRADREQQSKMGAWTSDTDPAYANFCGEHFSPLDPTDKRANELAKKRFGINKMPVLSIKNC